MLLIAGLGNPGRRYGCHRHNIGFMAAEAVQRRHGFSSWRARFEGEIAEGVLAGDKALILKPATYMNESGRAVGQAMRFYKLEPAHVVVIYDELDLPPGKLRMKRGGGTAGHNGLRSIEAHIGKDFRRMRIGIGHPGAKELVHGYVLHDLSKADRDWVDPLLSAVAENAPLLAKGEDATFMNRVHLALAPADEKGAASGPAKPASKASADVTPQRRASGAFAEGLKKLLRREQ